MISEAAHLEITRNGFPKKGDLLITCVGTIGRTCVYVSDEALSFQRSVAFLRLSTQAEPRFYKYFVESKAYQAQLDASSKASAQSGVYMGDLVSTVTVLTPLEEQTQIANFLDYETAKIDALIEKQQQLIRLLKEKRQAVISHAVTEGLNSDAPMRDSGVEWLGEVPAHWEVKRAKYVIAALESGVSVNAVDIPAEPYEIGVLKTSCVYTGEFRADENKTVVPEELGRVKCPVREQAIIISRMNTPDLVGSSGLVLGSHNNLFLPDRLWQMVFRHKVEVDARYLSYFLGLAAFRKQVSLAAEGASSSMQNITQADFLFIPLLLPPLQEQIQVATYLDEEVTAMQALIEKASTIADLLQERRAALISAAVTGKIDVRGWTPPESAAEQEVA
jgi:type I restriction enzyme S subunit